MPELNNLTDWERELLASTDAPSTIRDVTPDEAASLEGTD